MLNGTCKKRKEITKEEIIQDYLKLTNFTSRNTRIENYKSNSDKFIETSMRGDKLTTDDCERHQVNGLIDSKKSNIDNSSKHSSSRTLTRMGKITKKGKLTFRNFESMNTYNTHNPLSEDSDVQETSTKELNVKILESQMAEMTQENKVSISLKTVTEEGNT